MKIGFDLDGVLIEDSRSIMWALISKQTHLKTLFIRNLKPSIHPSMFLHDNDTACIITARQIDLRVETKKWCDKHFPGMEIIHAASPQWKKHSDWEKWCKQVAQCKADAINKFGVDVYFEDLPATVSHLRELCPNCTIIQYGGALGEAEKSQ